MSRNPIDPSNRKHPRKCDTKTATTKSKEAKTHYFGLFFFKHF